jgi:signal transduction histidine kinase
MLRETAYLLSGLPIALTSFAVLISGLCMSVFAVILFGLPAAIGTLLTARGFAKVERTRVRALGYELPPATYRPITSRPRTWLDVLRDSQSWLDLLHGIVVMPLTMVTWLIAAAWWAGALIGLSSVWLEVFTQPGGNSVFERLGPAEAALRVSVLTATGLALLLSTVPVMHRLALVHLAVDRLLLGNEQVLRLQGRVDALTLSRAAAVQAEATSLQRLERDLHDGPQQRLVRLGMDLSVVERRLADDPESARILLAEARMQTADALNELRALSRGIAPPILLDRGLEAALASIAARCTVQVDLHIGLAAGTRLPSSVERTSYFVVSEALANVAKHSGARRVRVSVLRDETLLRLEVEDDGIGGAHPAKGHGLAGLADRLAAVDGSLKVDSPLGGPTRLVAEIPCALS